jgi:hypothetical protein
MSSTSYKAHCVLKGCDAKFINGLVKSVLNGEDINNDAITKSLSIANSYDLKDCNKIILNHGDFHDAYLTIKTVAGHEIEKASKLRFYRQFAFVYIRQIINTKVKVKVDKIIAKKKT